MSSASIAINLSFKEPAGDLSEIQISPQVYDILSIGNILLTEDIPLLYETIGDCHFHTFKKKEEAADRIREILSDLNKESAKRQIEENRKIILQKHTWQKRVQQIIDLCS